MSWLLSYDFIHILNAYSMFDIFRALIVCIINDMITLNLIALLFDGIKISM